jgi:hypothetical protein
VCEIEVADWVFEADMLDLVGEGFIRARVWRVMALAWVR